MLTESKIRALKPRARRYTVTDARGLGLEVMPAGLKMWRLRLGALEPEGQFGGRRPCMLTLGRWPALNLTAARKLRAKVIERSLTKARAEYLRDPSEENPTVREFGARYIKEVIEVDRKDPKQLTRMLEKVVFARLGERVMSQVTGAEVRELIFRKRDAGKPSAAAALRNLMKRMWDYAIVCGAATVNPAHATPLKFIGRNKTRSRTLSRMEIGRFLNKLYASSQISRQHKLAVHLLLLTLVRKSELRLAWWEEIDFTNNLWEIPASHSKTGKPHIVFLSRQARDILLTVAGKADAVSSYQQIFPAANSDSQPMSASTLNAALARVKWGMPHFTIHDLRRTAATLLSEASYPPDVIEKALNHTIRGVRGVYNRAEYGEQRREMLQAWADMVDKWRAECQS